MARPDFSRSIFTNTIKCAEVKVVAGKLETVELAPVVKIGTAKLDMDKATKTAKAAYKKVGTLVVLGVEVKEEVRGMDFETFLKHSVPVERPASQQKKNK